MPDMSSIPGTPGWISSKGAKTDAPIKSVEVTEAGKTTPIEVKAE